MPPETPPNAQAITGQVRAFYEQMPFNYYATAAQASHSVADNPISAYPDLDALLTDPDIAQVLEIGCGAGWATNAIALNYNRTITAVDMTQKALDRAREVSRLIGTEDRTRFIHSDLFAFQPDQRFDLVFSIGVLHHTYDCRKAFDHVCGFVDKGSFLFVGLYHLAGRRVFLQMFQDILRAEGEEAAFRRFATLNPHLQDETHLRSWFRDQVLHPNETQHSLEEVMGWLDQNGLILISTSINGYDDVTDRQALIEDETAYEALSRARNYEENSFFPGFFTILAMRPD